MAHIWQISVVPSAAGQGRGRAMIEAAWGGGHKGLAAVALTTFRDVAWNGPTYARVGFRELDI